MCSLARHCIGLLNGAGVVDEPTRLVQLNEFNQVAGCSLQPVEGEIQQMIEVPQQQQQQSQQSYEQELFGPEISVGSQYQQAQVLQSPDTHYRQTLSSRTVAVTDTITTYPAVQPEGVDQLVFDTMIAPAEITDPSDGETQVKEEERQRQRLSEELLVHQHPLDAISEQGEDLRTPDAVDQALPVSSSTTVGAVRMQTEGACEATKGLANLWYQVESEDRRCDVSLIFANCWK